MSVHEVQTAAARVLHVDRVSDAAVQELQSRFRYHPLDIEALFSVPVEPLFSAYGHYSSMTLLWPDALTQDINELHFFVDEHQLTIVGDTSAKDIANQIATWQKDVAGPESQLTAPELVHQLVLSLYRPWQQNRTSPTAVAQHHFIGNAQVLRQLGRWLQSAHLPTAVPQLVIDAHALDSLAERQAVVIEEPSYVAPVVVPSLLRGYAVASAVVVIAVLVTLSVR